MSYIRQHNRNCRLFNRTLAVTISDWIFRDVLTGSPSREDPRH